jgi:hypothetical protein
LGLVVLPVPEVELLLVSESLPPEPATVVGLTLFWANEEAFLYAARVLGPERLDLMLVVPFNANMHDG